MLPDGATRWISSQGRVEYDATGRPVLIRGASRDVTARKRAELAVRNLSGRLLSAQEEERRRIARELHDNLGQQIALLAIEIEQLAMTPEPRTAVAESLRQLGARTAEISTEIHDLSHRLHSAKLETLGLQAAVQGHCRELRAQGLQVHVPGRERARRVVSRGRALPVPRRPGRAEQRRQAQRRRRGAGDAAGARETRSVDDRRLGPRIRRGRWRRSGRAGARQHARARPFGWRRLDDRVATRSRHDDRRARANRSRRTTAPAARCLRRSRAGYDGPALPRRRGRAALPTATLRTPLCRCWRSARARRSRNRWQWW